MEYTFRPLTAQDGQRLIAFYKSLSGESLARFTRDDISPVTLRRYCAMQAAEENDERGYVLTDAAGAIAALAKISQWHHPVPLMQIAAVDALQGEGVGTLLVQKLQAWVVESGKWGLRAVFAPENIRIHRLTQALGFRQNGTTAAGELLMLWETVPAAVKPIPPVDDTLTLRSGSRVRIRSVHEGDGPLMDRFFQELSKPSHAFFCPHPVEKEYLYKLCDGTPGDVNMDRLMVSRVENGTERMIGYVFLSRLTTGIASVGIGALDDVQGDGMGRAMLRYVQKQAVESGRTVLRLDTHRTNLRAQKLYKTCGFSQIGFANDGELLMLCPLALYED